MITKQAVREALSLAIRYFFQEGGELEPGERLDAIEALRFAQDRLALDDIREDQKKGL